MSAGVDAIPEYKPVRINRKFPEELETHFVQDLDVQHDEGYFLVSFFELWPPLILAESEEERRALFATLDDVESICVSRLVITPEKLRTFIEALEENIEKYESRFGADAE